MPDQPTPHGQGPRVTPLVVQDLLARDELGKGEYGEYLRSHNGRNSLLDAYNESLDQSKYLKQHLMEREAMLRWLRDLEHRLYAAGDTGNELVRRQLYAFAREIDEHVLEIQAW